ncbi:MAG: hypothetical protein HQL06_11245 [Nitrospirae bacterium]|nr:hypothetical protein [Nitrospirota bacterium]
MEQLKMPLAVIPAKAGIYFRELHKMLVYKKVQKHSYMCVTEKVFNVANRYLAVLQ